MVTLLKKIIGDPGEKAIDKIAQTLVPDINDLEGQMQARSDDELLDLTQQFRERLARGETLDDLLPEAFAAVREVARRKPGPAALRRPANRRHRPAPGARLPK